MSLALRLDAPAKLNLSLQVVGRREDGFHLLESELVLLELADRLLLMAGSSGLRVEGDPTNVPLDERNLAWRGLRAGLGAEPELACLALEKRIPVAAGLGGGSSDAAAAWRLGREWRGAADEPTDADTDELAAIGADVPFFAAGAAAARVSGIGERVMPSAATMLHAVLVHPPFELRTADVFAELRPDEWGTAPNDLLGPARRLLPELDEVMARFARAGGEPRLSGSGPTLFTLTDDPARAAAIAERLAGDEMRVTMSRTRTEAATIERIDDEEEPA